MNKHKTKNKDIVVLTGFGLFRDYQVNPSWEAVKLVDENEIDDVKLIKIQIPVVYDTTEQAVNEIWNFHNPILVIHCGVSSLAKGLNLEKRAVLNIERYCVPDVKSCIPKTKCSSTSQCQKQLDYICSNLDLDRIRDEINYHYKCGLIKLPAFVSDQAGEYLCEYIYRCSLRKNAQRTLFIHVPNISENLTSSDISKCLTIAIKATLLQIKNN